MPAWYQDMGDLWNRRFSAWGAMFVTTVVFALLSFDLIVTSRFEDKQAFNGLNETIKAMAMIAVGFWLGSSNSKQKQDETLAATAIEQTKTIAATSAALAVSTPAPVVTTTTIDPGPPPSATTTTQPVEPRP